MNAMLLSAGRGARMLPLTQSLPKAALPILGRPLAVQILHRLRRHGIERAVLNLHHLPKVLQDLLGDGSEIGLPRVEFSVEPEILGTGGGIRQAEQFLRGSGPFIVWNSDSLADVALDEALETHRRSGCLATLVLARARETYSAVDVDREGRVLSITGEPAVDPARIAGRYLYAGVQILEEQVLDRIPSDGASNIVRDVHVGLASEGRLAAYIHNGFWWEFGSPRLLLEGSMQLLDLPARRRQQVAVTDPVRDLGTAVAAVGTGAEFHNAVELKGKVALGFACRLGEGSHVEDSLVMPESWIGPGCRLNRTIVAPGVELPSGSQFDDALVCTEIDPHRPLPPETERRNGLLIRRL